MLAETCAGPGQEFNAFEQIPGDQGLENIQLELALAGRHLHCGVVAHHLNCHHGQAFTLGGIDLAGHDA